jgi:hypothetical protein
LHEYSNILDEKHSSPNCCWMNGVAFPSPPQWEIHVLGLMLGVIINNLTVLDCHFYY